MALGGTGNRTFLTQLRAASVDRDARVREFAYDGLTFMLGPDSFVDLRRGAKDTDPNVRARAVVSAYNMLELEGERRERRWPPATNQLISEVRAFLTEMEEDPVPFVSNNARSMLASIELKR
jgi:hypothetical protein